MVYQNILVFALIILFFSLVSSRLEKTAISAPFLAILFGLAAGPFVLDIIDVGIGIEAYRLVAELALALVLFNDASNINLLELRKSISLPVRLLLIGLPLTILAGVLGGKLIFKGFSLLELGILATLLAPTDAALGKAVVTNPRVPAKIRESLNVESGLNDGICVPVLFFMIELFNLGSGTEIKLSQGIILFAEEIGIGIVAGLVITFLADWFVNRAEEKQLIPGSWKSMIIIAMALICFATAQVLGGSGFIAAFTGGLFYGARNRKYKHHFLESSEGLGDTLSLLTWLIFGAIIISATARYFTWAVLVYSLLSLTVIRIIPVLLALMRTGIPFSEKLFISWFGPRGLASIVFAIIVFNVELPHRETLILTAVCTILLSIILHGFTAKPFINALNKSSNVTQK